VNRFSSASLVPGPGLGAENKVERTKDDMGDPEPQNEPGPIHRKKTIANRRYQSAQGDYDPIGRSHFFHLLATGVLVMADVYIPGLFAPAGGCFPLIFLTVKREINGMPAGKRMGSFSSRPAAPGPSSRPPAHGLLR
jgi:hypothetical protein